jgi:hypothetical protein
MIGSGQMIKDKRNNTTIDLNATKRQRSSEKDSRAYFNPYAR